MSRNLEAERLKRELREHTAAVREANRQARRARRGSRWTFRNGVMPSIPWGDLLRIASVVCMIGLLIFLWQIRFSITAAIWDVIVALMPSIITIVAIIWLI